MLPSVKYKWLLLQKHLPAAIWAPEHRVEWFFFFFKWQKQLAAMAWLFILFCSHSLFDLFIFYNSFYALYQHWENMSVMNKAIYTRFTERVGWGKETQTSNPPPLQSSALNTYRACKAAIGGISVGPLQPVITQTDLRFVAIWSSARAALHYGEIRFRAQWRL